MTASEVWFQPKVISLQTASHQTAMTRIPLTPRNQKMNPERIQTMMKDTESVYSRDTNAEKIGPQKRERKRKKRPNLGLFLMKPILLNYIYTRFAQGNPELHVPRRFFALAYHLQKKRVGDV
jgi:hypothetical protein